MDLRKAIVSSDMKKTRATEKTSQLCEPVLSLLNKQMDNEMNSAHLYFGMAIWLTQKGFDKLANSFLSFGKEERGHMDKIQNYIQQRAGELKHGSVVTPKTDYKDLKDVLLEALNHEIMVTEQWNNIAETAMKHCDFTTMFFAKWFLEEQIEEEEKFRKVLMSFSQGMAESDLDFFYGEVSESPVTL